MDCAVLLFRLGGQAESWFGHLEPAVHELGRVPPDLRAMFETVAGARADQQHVRGRRVPVDEQVASRAVLVLADALLVERSAGERGETPGQVGARISERAWRGDPIAAIRID